METGEFEKLMDYLDYNMIDLNVFYFQILNQEITYKEVEQFFYGMKLNHENRFQLFICLHEASLKNHPEIAIRAFREAYCASNNIFHQIKTSSYIFNLKNFINTLKEKGFELKSIMNDDELNYYESLADKITIYRGMCYEEYQSKDFGISWTIDKKEAVNYSYFSKNNVRKGKGCLFNMEIKKENITTIFKVYDKFEIIYLKKNDVADL